MASFQGRTAALLVACIALTAAPAFAQRGGRQDGDEGRRGRAVERAQPRGDGQRGEREVQRRREPRERGGAEGRVEPQRREPQRPQVERRVEPQRREPQRPQVERRVEPRRRDDPQRQEPRRPGARDVRPGSGHRNDRAYEPPRFAYRPYVSRPRIAVPRPRIVPYGYRPYGYRQGWNLSLYFGRPYPIYGHRVYESAAAAYGYYAVVPGISYGALRIVDVPRDAHVFVDGYYAGVVDDYDGVFQHLNLEAGSHHIEIELDDELLEAFDVYIQPGRTITYRATYY